MKWTDKDIVDWHIKTFPDADLPSQLMKLEEELKEFYEAIHKKDNKSIRQELADVYIVCIVLRNRYKSYVGLYILHHFFFSDKTMKCVYKKMDINVQRTWVKVNGVYRHKDIDTD